MKTDKKYKLDKLCAKSNELKPALENVDLNNGSITTYSTDGLEPDSYPDYKRVLPSSPVVFSVGINAKLLLELAQGLGNEKLVLSFHESGFNESKTYKSAISVKPGLHAEEKGLIMPIDIDKIVQTS